MKEPASPDAAPAAPSLTPLDASDEERLLGASPLGVFRTDEQGHCLYTNASWQAIYGLTLAESLGDGWARGVHPDDRDAVAAQWLDDTRNSRPFDHVFRVRRRDGTVRHVRSQAWAVPGGFVGAVEDITHSEQRARQLRSTLQLLDRTGQIAGVGGWDIDLRSRHVRWSAQTCRIHDRPLDWQPDIESAIEYYAPEARPVIAGLVDRAIRFGEPFDVELPLITATGRRLLVRAAGDVENEGGEPVRLYGAFQDVTAQRSADEEVRRSREQLRHLYDETPALMASVDATGRVVSVSRLLVERLGLSRESVVGRQGSTLLAGPPDDQAFAIQRVASRLRDPDGIRALPLRLAHRDGSTVHTLMSAVVERDAAGRLQRLLAVFEDVTESMRRQAELDRERALREEVERQAAELLRLADERREMLDVLAHEVRQPLNLDPAVAAL